MTKRELIKVLQQLDCPDETNVRLWNSGIACDTYTNVNEVNLISFFDSDKTIEITLEN